MKALILAAGLGSRLRPLTDRVPKPLIEVGGEAMIDRVAEKLVSGGCTELVVNVHHLADLLEEHLRRADYGVPVKISDEREKLLDTGGAILRAARLLEGEGPIVVYNSDIICDIDIRELVDEHVMRGNDVTLVVNRRKTSRRLLFDRSGRMCGWHNESNGDFLPEGIEPTRYEKMSFCGIHVLSPNVLDDLREYGPGEVFPIIPFYVSEAQKRRIGCFELGSEEGWYDIGKPETLEAVRGLYS